MTRKREIPKIAQAPKLNDRVVTLLTRLCFMEHREGYADIIFVFGSRFCIDENAEIVHDLLERGLAKEVVLTGGSPEFDDLEQMDISEAELLLKKIRTEDFPNVKFYYEDKSHHTLANVTEAMQVVNFDYFDRIIFVAKSFASRRAYLSLKKYLPDKKYLSVTYDAAYPDEQRITQKNWYSTEEGRGRVWGEFLRIKKYGEKGDIEYGEPVRRMIKEIEELTGTPKG